MNICTEHGREDIAHEGRNCPACAERDDLKSSIEELIAKVKELEDKIETLEE